MIRLLNADIDDRLRALLKFYEDSPVAVVVTDTDFNLLWNNKSASDRVFPLLDADMTEFLFNERTKERILKKMSSGQTVVVHDEFILPMRSIIATFVPAFNSAGKDVAGRHVTQIIIYFSELTAENYSELEYAQMVAINFDTQIREPLSEIFTSIDGLKNRALSVESSFYEPYLGTLSQNAYKVLRNYTLISNYTKIQNGVEQFRFKKVCASEFFYNLFTSIKVVAENREQQLMFSINIENNVYINIDEEKFVTAFMQFVSNSCKHRDKGVLVRINAYHSNNRVVARIEDNGRGIPSNILPEIFNPYFSYSPTYPSAGTGLGLTLAKIIMKKHNGSVAVSSEEDIGTVVALSLDAYTEQIGKQMFLKSFVSELVFDKFSPVFIYLADSLTPPTI